MKLIKKSILFLVAAASLAGGRAYAQRPLIDVAIDSAAILIGEQTTLHLTVTADKDRPVQIVIPNDTLMTGVEVLNLSKADSTEIENDRLVIKQDVLITSFDSSLYLLPPLKVIDGVDTVYSNQVALKVSTIPVNADKPEEFNDIKTVWKPPFVWADYYPIIYGILLALFLICVIAYIVKRIRAKKSLIPFKKEEPKLPPHEQAIKELDEIKQQKLWQQGRSKEYYTLITDTLRKYIEERFGINAMEMTSGEILELIRKNSEAQSVYDNLRQILQLADFVKFAKMNPLPDENDLSMMNAYLFVNQTKVEEMQEPESTNDTTNLKDKEMVCANPNYLYLLLLLIPMIGWYVYKLSKSQASLQVSSSEAFEAPGAVSWIVYLRHVPFVLRMVAVALLIVILARPQSTNSWSNSSTEGIDIMLAMDISGSMLAQDLKPNRLEAAKDVAASFINGRPNDNIGLVVFSAESFTQCPLTTDHTVLLNLFKDIQSGMIQDGTAIGLGLANAVSRIKDSHAKSKVIILLTDGSNNAGEIAPVTAAEIAKTFGVRVYTIGVGTKGMAPYPFQTAFGVQYQNIPVEIDEATLKQIASTTGGQYFRATDNASLKEIYSEIDQMEKTKISVQEYSKKQEEYKNWALLVFALLLVEILLRNTLLRNIP